MRLIILLAQILVIGVGFSEQFSPSFDRLLLGFVVSLSTFFLPLKAISDIQNWRTLLTIAAGFLLIINEINTLIRYILQIFRIRPMPKPADAAGQTQAPYKESIILIPGRMLVYLQDEQIDGGEEAEQPEAVSDIPKAREEVDTEELKTGRIIGILERIIIYALVLNIQYAAIGIIIAAKGFTRYKELENRDTAEYILIGTLLSTILAILVGNAIIIALR